MAGGSFDAITGWFVRPTLLTCDDPGDEVFTTEYFGPLLAVFVYDDADYQATLDLVDDTSRYGLTGAVFARDRAAISAAARTLRFAAGNFYVNDKPTGASSRSSRSAAAAPRAPATRRDRPPACCAGPHPGR